MAVSVMQGASPVAPANDSMTAPSRLRTWSERSPNAFSMSVRAARDSCTSLSAAIAVNSCNASPTDCAQRASALLAKLNLDETCDQASRMHSEGSHCKATRSAHVLSWRRLLLRAAGPARPVVHPLQCRFLPQWPREPDRVAAAQRARRRLCPPAPEDGHCASSQHIDVSITACSAAKAFGARVTRLRPLPET